MGTHASAQAVLWPELIATAREAARGGDRAGPAVRLAEGIGEARAGSSRKVLGLDRARLLALDGLCAAHLYELLLDDAGRAHGAWYTPRSLAAYLVGRARPNGAIIDPACGGGVFLLEAARQLGDPSRLFALDRDPGALRVARAVLAADGFAVPAENFVCADALLEPWPRPAFGAVIGNPPFVNIVRLETETRRALKARYRTFRNKCDLYGLFVEAATDYLEPGGRLAFVLSDSFLGTSSFAPLRRLLFGGETLGAVEVARVRGRAFAAAVNPLLVVGSRRAQAPGEAVRLVTVSPAGEELECREVSASWLAARAEKSAHLPGPGEASRTARVASAETTLGRHFELSLGVKTGDDARFVSARPKGPSWVPCARGRTVARYRAGEAGFLDYRPEVLRTVHGARPRRRESFDRPLKILLRETSGGRLIAAMDTRRLVPLDTLHVLHPREDGPAPCSLWTLLALLNGELTSAFYGEHHPGPHVKAAEVRALPLPRFPPPDPAALALALPPAVVYVMAGDPGAPAPEDCLLPGARAALLDLLARWLTAQAQEGPRARAARRLIDVIVEDAYGARTGGAITTTE